jgi:hypothetical protein
MCLVINETGKYALKERFVYLCKIQSMLILRNGE